MPRKGPLKPLSSDSSDEDEPLSKLAKKPKGQSKAPNGDDSSSESDIENYLQRADKIDLDSPFFRIQKVDNVPSFDKIENNIFAGVTRLTDSESDEENKVVEHEEVETFTQAPSTSKLNFGQLHEYTKKLEEARRHVEEYNRRRQEKIKETDIGSLLALGEAKLPDQDVSLEETLNSSDFESCSDSEKEGWEEVEDQKEQKSVIPAKNLEIRVDMPGAVKKKKEVDLLAAIKRRINKVRKENQILVHKVHLLCWLAHGNYVSAKINSESVLGVALSLLPSEKCYPASRTDLSYLEQVLKWFRSAVINVEKKAPDDESLEELLEAQIMKKEAYDKKMLVYIFIAIMRSLGIHCRLVLSLQAEPLRPPNSELLSLSAKAGPSEMKSEENQKRKSRTKSVSEEVKDEGEPKETKKCRTESVNGEEKKSGSSGKGSQDRKSKAKRVSEEEKKPTSSGKDIQIEKGNTKSVNEEEKKARSSGKEIQIKKGNRNSVKVVEEAKKVKSSRSGKSEESKSIKRGVKTVETKQGGKDRSEEAVKVRAKSTSEAVKGRKKTPAADLLKLRSSTRTKSTSELPPKDRSEKVTKKNPFATRTQPEEPKSAKETRPTRSLRSQRNAPIPQLDGADDDASAPSKPNLKKLKQRQPACPIRNHPRRLESITKFRDSDSEDDFEATRSPFSNKSNDSPKSNGANLRKLRSVDVRNDVVELVKKSIRRQRDVDRSRTARKRRSGEGSDDSDYVPEAVKKKHRESEDEFAPKVKVKRRVQVKPDPEEEKVKKKPGVDVWAEVFLETEEKWISVDVVKGQVHCVNELFTRASHPISYIVAWNNDNTLKDITRRYCTNYNTVTRKLRIDAKWWEQSLKPFTGGKTARDREEDEELERQQLEKPLPTVIGEYKNHPLYVLKRHLLKFEALYPPDPPTLGFVRKEPVYSRQCVYVLHSRDLWLKHARVVKPGEQPYKIVKARPRWDKLSNSIVTGEMLEIFGIWQTQEYDPPTAENGVVPRNAFGNVELFKACMLPKKTVHLKLPGLNKVAKRLDMDCAPALVGFDFHGGWNHPTYDGFVVCEENADILVAAWELEQDEIEKREQEKVDKRVYGNWRRLIRGLLIRERLKAKYEFGEPSGGGAKKKKGPPTFSTKKRKVESDSD